MAKKLNWYMRDLLSGKKLTTLPLADECRKAHQAQLAAEAGNG
ncbi:hypothetical protein ACGGXQ_004475 [Salmonella enterica]